MKKADCINRIPSFVDKWIEQNSYDKMKKHDLSFDEFYYWLEENYAQYINFRSTCGARHDISLKFDNYTNLLSKRNNSKKRIY